MVSIAIGHVTSGHSCLLWSLAHDPSQEMKRRNKQSDQIFAKNAKVHKALNDYEVLRCGALCVRSKRMCLC